MLWWLNVAAVVGAIWAYSLSLPLSSKSRFHAKLFPVYCLVCLGVYMLFQLIVGVVSMRDYPDAMVGVRGKQRPAAWRRSVQGAASLPSLPAA